MDFNYIIASMLALHLFDLNGVDTLVADQTNANSTTDSHVQLINLVV